MKSPSYHAADYCFVLEDCDLLSTLREPLKCHFPSPESLFKSFWMSVFWSLDVFFMFIVGVQIFVLVRRKAVNFPLCVTWCWFFLNLSRPNIPGSYWRHISFFFSEEWLQAFGRLMGLFYINTQHHDHDDHPWLLRCQKTHFKNTKWFMQY